MPPSEDSSERQSLRRSPAQRSASRGSPESAEIFAASALEVAIDGAANLWFTAGSAVAWLWGLWLMMAGVLLTAVASRWMRAGPPPD